MDLLRNCGFVTVNDGYAAFPASVKWRQPGCFDVLQFQENDNIDEDLWLPCHCWWLPSEDCDDCKTFRICGLQWLPNASKGTHPAKLLQSGRSVPASLLFAARLTSLGFDNERIHCVPAQFSRTPACCPLEAIMILPSLSPGHSKLPRGQRSLHPAGKKREVLVRAALGGTAFHRFFPA